MTTIPSKYLFRLLMLFVCSLLPLHHAAAGEMWISAKELSELSTSGSTWDSVLSKARNSTNNPDLSNQNDTTDTDTLAKALVYARTGNRVYGDEVLYTLQRLVELHPVARSDQWTILATLRSLGSYAIAADLIDLESYAPNFDKNTFRPWLDKARFAETNTSVDAGGTLVSRQERRPNNFGGHASASRIAASLYLGDQTDLNRAVQVFKGWLGDRSSYAGFKYGDLSWQADQSRPVGINPKGSTIGGRNVDGVLPDDARRCGTFDASRAPCKSNYMWEGLQGAVVAAELLHRAGYPAFEWSDRAILRAVRWLYNTTFDDGQKYPAEGDDRWQIYIINKRYGTNFAVSSTTAPGKMVGYTEWSHSANAGSGTTPSEPVEPSNPTEPSSPSEPTQPPNGSGLSVVSAQFWSSSGNLQLTLESAAPGATIYVVDATLKVVAFGKAPNNGSEFSLKNQFYSSNGQCNYAVYDGTAAVPFSVKGSGRFGCGARK